MSERGSPLKLAESPTQHDAARAWGRGRDDEDDFGAGPGGDDGLADGEGSELSQSSSDPGNADGNPRGFFSWRK